MIQTILTVALPVVAIAIATFFYIKSRKATELAEAMSTSYDSLLEENSSLMLDLVKTGQMLNQFFALNAKLSESGTTIVTDEYRPGLELEAAKALSDPELILPYIEYDDVQGRAVVNVLNPNKVAEWREALNTAYIESHPVIESIQYRVLQDEDYKASLNKN